MNAKITMQKFAILVNVGGATFVKYYDYFVSQGGLTQDWGKSWKIVEAETIEGARVQAIKLPGAREGLYCGRCGRDRSVCMSGGVSKCEPAK